MIRATYFDRGGGMGVLLDIDDDIVVVVTVVDVSGNEFNGNDICFLARGGGGGKRSELDETFDLVSSLDVLVLEKF
jgi:hypothetical protein